MMLSAADHRRYARHLLLSEIGPAGQARLLASVGAITAGADARAAEVARDYLRRAGIQLSEASGGGSAESAVLRVEVASTATVAALAGRPELVEAAAALAGSFAAVEAIKAALGVGVKATLPSALQCSSGGEHAP